MSEKEKNAQKILRIIIHSVATKHNILMEELLGKNRERSLVDLRKAMVATLWQKGTATKSGLAELFKKDHATIIFMLKKHNDLIDGNNKEYLDLYTKVYNQIVNELNEYKVIDPELMILMHKFDFIQQEMNEIKQMLSDYHVKNFLCKNQSN